ncbi:MAG: sugar kinase [Candidatus Marinimicrobia bacterium]|nr:sugar kinase [Candidatus Neomarinimicrobiota bacterium]
MAAGRTGSRRGRTALDLVVVGSVGIDTVATPAARREEVLGGSCPYACVAAALLARAGMVGVVGDDFPRPFRALYQQAGVDLDGLQVAPGRTFRWEGVYQANMDSRHTLRTELNVFADFRPELPPAYRAVPLVLLANIAPELQLHVINQIRRPRFVMVDTMDLWINTCNETLAEVIRHVDLLTVNESEALLWTGSHSLVQAARTLIQAGPRFVIVKRGAAGAMLCDARRLALVPAYPLGQVTDPTGAGDAFAGGFMGALAREPRLDWNALRRALLVGAVTGSFACEGFSLEALAQVTPPQLQQRARALHRMVALA